MLLFLSSKRIQLTTSDFVITGLDNFSIIYDNTTVTNKRTDVHVNFPEVTVKAKTTLSKNDGSLSFTMQNVDLIFYAAYDERRDILSVKEINGRIALGSSVVSF